MSTEVGAIYYSVDARTAGLLKAEKDVDGSTKRMEKGFDRTDKASRRMGEGFNSAGGAALRLRNIVTAVSSAMATRQIIAYSDAWGRTQNQLRQVTTSTAELRDINQQLMDISNRSAVAFENTAGFYARVAQATRNLNIEQAQLIEFVDLTSQSLRANGTSAAGASALILQLSQAFNAGIIQGEEFNTIIDQAPLLLEALQRETGKGVRELKKMGSEGSLSIDMLIKSVRNYSDEIERRAAASTNTFADNLTVARNNMIEFVGSSNSAQGVVGKLGESVIYLSNNLELVTQGAIALSAVIAGRYATALGAAAIANISLAGSSIRRMQALRAEAQASNQAATAKLQEVQASIAVTKSIMAEVQADRAALAAKLATTKAIGTQIAIKRELAAMDATLTQYKSRYTALIKAETAATAQSTAVHRANASVLATTTRSAQVATRAMGGLRAVMGLLGGPAGVIMLAGWAIYHFREELGLVPKPVRETADIVDELRQRIDGLSESALKFEMAGFTAELFRLQVQAARTKSELDALMPDQEAASGRQGPRAAFGAMDQRRDNAPEIARLQRELEQAGNDIEARQQILAQINEQLNSPDSNGRSRTPPGSSSSDSEAKRLAREFESVQRELETQREQIERAYRERNEVIRRATEAGSAQQEDLLARSEQRHAKELANIDELGKAYSGLRDELRPLEESQREYAKSKQTLISYAIREKMDAIELGRLLNDLDASYQSAQTAAEAYGATSRGALKDNQQLAQDLGMTFTSTFEDAVIEGNKFRDVLTGIAEDIQRILLRQSVTKPAANAISSAVGGLNFGGMFGGGGAIDGGWTSQIATAGYASGGYTGSGSRNEPAGIVHRGEYVMPKNVVDQPGMRSHLEGLKSGQRYLSMGSSGGSSASPKSGGVTVQVIDQRSSGEPPAVEQSSSPDGGRMLRIMVRDEVKGAFSSGALDKTMNLNYGINRRGR